MPYLLVHPRKFQIESSHYYNYHFFHQRNPTGHQRADLEGHEGRGNGAHNELTLAADVPEAHLKGQRKGHTGQRQRHG